MIVYILFSKSTNTFMDCIDWLQNKNYSFMDVNYDDENFKFQISEIENNLVKISFDKEKKIDAIVSKKYALAISQSYSSLSHYSS